MQQVRPATSACARRANDPTVELRATLLLQSVTKGATPKGVCVNGMLLVSAPDGQQSIQPVEHDPVRSTCVKPVGHAQFVRLVLIQT